MVYLFVTYASPSMLSTVIYAFSYTDLHYYFVFFAWFVPFIFVPYEFPIALFIRFIFLFLFLSHSLSFVQFTFFNEMNFFFITKS